MDGLEAVPPRFHGDELCRSPVLGWLSALGSSFSRTVYGEIAYVRRSTLGGGGLAAIRGGSC